MAKRRLHGLYLGVRHISNPQGFLGNIPGFLYYGGVITPLHRGLKFLRGFVTKCEILQGLKPDLKREKM